MCGRYRVKAEIELNAPAVKLSFRMAHARWNLAPTQMAPVVSLNESGPEHSMMRWGLVPSWSKDQLNAAKLINARSETVAEKPSFRSAFKHRRCLIPAHGYYEWKAVSSGKQPFHFQRAEGKVMCFAGLWEQWHPHEETENEPPLETFTIITTQANELAARYHDRMPVILPEQNWDHWLNPQTKPDDLKPLLVPFAGEMDCWAVTPRMNNVRFESPECAEPVQVQANLFGDG